MFTLFRHSRFHHHRHSFITPYLTRSISSRAGVGPQIGFIGLGQMGKHMAGHFVKNGYNPIVYDSDVDALNVFVEANRLQQEQPQDQPTFRIAESVRQIGDQSNVIFTMLPSGNDVREVYFGPEGIFPNGFAIACPDRLYLVDCSTIGPTITQELSRKVFRLGHHHVDAPVTGGVIGAEKGTLNFICGGHGGDVEKISPLLAVMGKNFFHCGSSGSGQIAKICNNSVLAITMMAVSESLRLAKAAGLDVATVSEIYNLGSAKSWVTDLYNPVPGVIPTSPASNNYKGGFKTELIEKDLSLMLETSAAFSIDVPSVRLAKELYHHVVESGGGKDDFSVIYQFPSEPPAPKHKS